MYSCVHILKYMICKMVLRPFFGWKSINRLYIFSKKKPHFFYILPKQPYIELWKPHLGHTPIWLVLIRLVFEKLKLDFKYWIVKKNFAPYTIFEKVFSPFSLEKVSSPPKFLRKKSSPPVDSPDSDTLWFWPVPYTRYIFIGLSYVNLSRSYIEN